MKGVTDMFNILELSCTSDISSCCSDYGVATYLFIIKNILNVVHIIVPIILMVMGVVGFIQMMVSPDDPQKKKSKSLYNKFIAAIIVFFIPYIMDLIFQMTSFSGLTPETLNFAGCYQAADDVVTQMRETEEYDAFSPRKKTKVKYDIDLNVIDKEIEKEDEKNSSDIKGTKEGRRIVKYAQKFIGNKYVYGGTSLTNGVDCSGFTKKVYGHFGYYLPRTSSAQATAGKKVSSLNEAQAGDLIYYGNHVAIYEGNGKVIHASNSAPYPKGGIKESTATYRTILAIRRII